MVHRAFDDTHLAKGALANDLDRPEVVHAQLGALHAEEGRFLLPQLLQLALLPLLRHQHVPLQLALQLDSSVR